MRRKWIAALCLGLMCALGSGSAVSAGKRYLEFPREGFRLELPQRWVKIPQDVFREKMRPLKKALEKSDSRKQLGYDHGVQLKSKEWFRYPYMLVSHWEDSRVDTEEMPQMNRKIEESLLKEGKGVNGTRLVGSSFDPERNYYRAETRFTISGRRMVLLKGVYYLNQGVLQLSTYMPERMYPTYAPEIKQAVDNLEIDADRVHRASQDRWLEFEDVIPYLKVLIATVVVFVVAGIYVWHRRRGKGES
ncbi:MAG: hypothetical protein K9J48_03115 [Desulfohalobiaceae bacterium]|nr:hypothetical protein [Desulfohalobiaceae bacterium]